MNAATLYRKKPVVVEAVQWRTHGDHPHVVPATREQAAGVVSGLLWEHAGWVKTLEGGHLVTPGDWIICGVKGEHYPCKPDIFAATYAPVSAENANYAGITLDDLRAVESEVYATESVEQIGLMPFAKALLALVARRLETP